MRRARGSGRSGTVGGRERNARGYEDGNQHRDRYENAAKPDSSEERDTGEDRRQAPGRDHHCQAGGGAQNEGGSEMGP
jgi:hypothetical protein